VRPTTGQPTLPLAAPSLEFGRPPDSTVKRSPRPKPSPAAPVDEDRVGDYRHPDASRTNIPEAGVATQDRSVVEKSHFKYRQGDLPPFDPHEDPQLVWAGKAEHTSFDVDTVSLHIHERVSTAAILRAVRREEVQRTLFSDPQFSIDQEH
jgi:adenine-specific DNA-methyltransferase